MVNQSLILLGTWNSEIGFFQFCLSFLTNRLRSKLVYSPDSVKGLFEFLILNCGEMKTILYLLRVA